VCVVSCVRDHKYSCVCKEYVCVVLYVGEFGCACLSACACNTCLCVCV
jgi:hypothetical protein